MWSHHEVIGRRVGLTEDDLAVLQSERPSGADAATTLLSDESRYLTGQSLILDGGATALR